MKSFARDEFGLKHRYALVLHTDEPHPHVHMVVKAMSEQGERLHIRKATLRRWRADFASHLRAQGVPANATERAVRGATRSPKLDAIYRAARRGQSTHFRSRLQDAVTSVRTGAISDEAGKARLLATRKKIERGWSTISEILMANGQSVLAAQVKRFMASMPLANTDREWLEGELRQRSQRSRTHVRSPLPS